MGVIIGILILRRGFIDHGSTLMWRPILYIVALDSLHNQAWGASDKAQHGLGFGVYSLGFRVAPRLCKTAFHPTIVGPFHLIFNPSPPVLFIPHKRSNARGDI